MNSQTVSDCSSGNRRLLRAEHRWLKTDQQVRLHLNRFSPTTSLAFNVQQLEDKACWQIFSYDSSVHKQCDDVLKISQERNYPRNAAAESIQSRNSSSHLSHTFLLVNTFSFLSVHPSPAVHQPSQTSRAHLLQTINSQKIFHHYEPDAGAGITGIKLFYSLPIQNQGSWLVGCVSRQN